MAWPTITISTTSMDASTDDASQARADIKQMADNVNAIKDSRGAASGIPELDASSLIPVAQLPVLPANKGGSGQSAYTVGDILYASATNTLTKLAAGTLGYVLTSNGPGNAPSWQQSGGGLVSGTRMPFNQTSAPTGWTKDTTFNDSIMRVVSGVVSNGGSTAFSTFNAQTTVGATTLTISQIPSHSHSVGISQDAGSKQGLNVGVNPMIPSGSITSGAQGGGGSHSHSITTSIKYNDFIIAQKD